MCCAPAQLLLLHNFLHCGMITGPLYDVNVLHLHSQNLSASVSASVSVSRPVSVSMSVSVGVPVSIAFTGCSFRPPRLAVKVVITNRTSLPTWLHCRPTACSCQSTAAPPYYYTIICDNDAEGHHRHDFG